MLTEAGALLRAASDRYLPRQVFPTVTPCTLNNRALAGPAGPFCSQSSRSLPSLADRSWAETDLKDEPVKTAVEAEACSFKVSDCQHSSHSNDDCDAFYTKLQSSSRGPFTVACGRCVAASSEFSAVFSKLPSCAHSKYDN